MTPDEILLFVVLGSLTVAAGVANYAKDDYSGLLAVLAVIINIALVLIATISDLIPTPNPVFDQPLELTTVYPVILLGVLVSLVSLVLLFKIQLISKVKGDRLILRDEPIAMFHRSDLASECRYNASRRCDLYLSHREEDSQFVLPLEDLDGLANLMEKDGNVDESITCCRCNHLKPKFTGIAHIQDLKEADWRPICEDCTIELLNEVMEQEDNYISEELILSRTV